jgi:hypothetical protein
MANVVFELDDVARIGRLAASHTETTSVFDSHMSGAFEAALQHAEGSTVQSRSARSRT